MNDGRKYHLDQRGMNNDESQQLRNMVLDDTLWTKKNFDAKQSITNYNSTQQYVGVV